MIILLWQAGLIDNLSLIKILNNSETQYNSILGTATIGHISHIESKVLLKPILSLVTNYQFIGAA